MTNQPSVQTYRYSCAQGYRTQNYEIGAPVWLIPRKTLKYEPRISALELRPTDSFVLFMYNLRARNS